MDIKYKEPFFTLGLIKDDLPYHWFKLRLIKKILFNCKYKIDLSKMIDDLQDKGEI